MINTYLQELGLRNKEVSVYLCVLENGKMSAASISRITKINRATVYSITKELINKSFLHEDLGGTNRYFVASQAEELRSIYLKQEKELQKKRETIENTIKELKSIPKSKQYSVPKIRFIDEMQLEDFLYKQLPVWIESAQKYEDHNWWGFQDVSLAEAFPEWFEYHWKIFPPDFGMKMFTNKKPTEEVLAKKYFSNKRGAKYWDKSLNFTATHAVLGDYVIFCVTNQRPYYLVETHDVVMAKNLRDLFKNIWDKI